MQKCPALQSSQLVAPSSSWKEPAAHLAHVLLPLVDVIVPGAQAVVLDAPVGHAYPGGHGSQSDGPVAPIELRYLPASHALGALTPATQNDPAGQS